MMRALVVDDKEPNLEYLRALLEGAGWTVEVARHGAEAIALAKQRVPDLVISDLLMPIMDGYTLLRHWKNEPRLQGVPFIVYTATYTDRDDERLALELGADAFILKPTEPEDFLAQIRRVQESGPARRPIVATEDAPGQLSLYNAALVRRLEIKSFELEQANRQLELELAARATVERLLHDRGARLNLFLELGEILRATDPEQLLGDAMRLLGEHFGVSRCAYVELLEGGKRVTIRADYADHVPSIVGQHQLPALGLRLLADLELGSGAIIVRDPARELGSEEQAQLAAFDLGAFICMPLVRHGTLHAVLFLGQPAPRDWIPIDTAVIREVLDRCTGALERHAFEDKLRQSATLLQIAGRVARLGGWSVELPGDRVIWSDEMCVIHDAPLGTQPSPEQAFEYYAPEFRDAVRATIRTCIVEGTSFELEAQIVTTTNRRVWVRCIGQAERDRLGVTTRLHGALQDIDETRKLQDQFRQAQKMEAVGRLAGGVAHDFNNLLSVIISYAGFLLEDLPADNPVRDDVAEINRAAEKATDLTRQLLTFSRHKAIERRVIDLAPIVQAMQSMLRRLLGEDIELSLQVSKQPSRAFSDASQIEQIVMNLAVNARDAMPDGGKLVIEVANVLLDAEYATNHHGVAMGPYVMISVSDTGVGMDPATREKIFEPFFTTKEKGKGTGLGLSTVFGIAQQSGGFVWVYSEVGIGTTFKVYMPRTEDQVDPVAAPTVAPSTLRGTETVLVVEDDAQVRQMTGTMLRRHGYTVLDAADGAEALQIFAQHRAAVRLMITDVVMPRMSGRELADQIVAAGSDVRVLFFSGYTEETIIHHGMLEPGIAFLEKPVSSEILLRKVRELLDR